MESLLNDFRYGARLMRRTPGPTAIAVLALAFGIGLTTMMFSIIWGAWLRGLPFDEPQNLMIVWRTNPAVNENQMWPNVHDLSDWRAEQNVFEDLSGYFSGTVNVSGDGAETPERYNGSFITPAAFRMLRVPPVMGRTFTDEDDKPGAPLAVILGWTVWQQRFAGDPAVVGRTLRANGEVGTVIGVMPEGFGFPTAQQIWLPLRIDALQAARGEGRGVQVFGRLRDGVSQERAATQLAGIANRIAAANSNTDSLGVNIRPYVETVIDEEPRALLTTMFGAVVFVLLIACVNVANLLIGRAMIRGKEVAIRTAMGATRGRIAAQFLIECLVLAIAGAVLGTGIAAIGVRAFNNSLAPTNPPFWIDIKIDSAALFFVSAAVILATLAAGAFPAIQAARANTHDILKDEARGSSSFRLGRMSRWLVVAEIALSVALLVGAGLTIKSVFLLRTVDMGFATDQFFTARIGLPETTYREPLQQTQFAEQLLPRLQGMPGAAWVTFATALPGLGGGRSGFTIEGSTYQTDNEVPAAAQVSVGPGFFQTFDAPVRGRAFGPEDRDGSLPVAIVNESFERRFFTEGGAIGRRIRPGGRESQQPWLTIIGVTRDMYITGIQNEEPEGFYRPFAQSPGRFFNIVVRARDPMVLTAQVRQAVAAQDGDLPLYFVQRLDAGIAQASWFYRVFGNLFAIFGIVALFLAAVGLYGVMSFSVSQRTREMGVRLALGAGSRDVLRLVFSQGMIQTGIGLVLGGALAFWGTRFLTIILFRVNPRDPLIFATILLVLLASAAFACWLPARRATRVDPLEALRFE